MSSQRQRQLVAIRFRYGLALEGGEDAGAPPLRRLIVGDGHNVHMDVAMVGVLGELGDVSLPARGDVAECNRRGTSQQPEFSRLARGEIGNGVTMRASDEHQPSADAGVV